MTSARPSERLSIWAMTCVFCGTEIAPPDRHEIPRCRHTWNGWHLNNLAAATMSKAEIEHRKKGTQVPRSRRLDGAA